MSPAMPPNTNSVFTAPDNLDPSQVGSIHAFRGVVPSGHNLEGADFVVVAWRPTPDELRTLSEGGLLYMSYLGGKLAPHFLSADFAEATYGLCS